jgi:hypothetical protein
MRPSFVPSYIKETQPMLPGDTIMSFWSKPASYFVELLLIMVVLLICASSISIAIEHIQKRLRRR